MAARGLTAEERARQFLQVPEAVIVDVGNEDDIADPAARFYRNAGAAPIAIYSDNDDDDSQLHMPLLGHLLSPLRGKAASEPPFDLIKERIEEGEPDVSSVQAEIIALSRKVAGETIASFVVIFTLLAVKINTYGYGATSELATSFIGGLVVMVAIFSLGHVSGSHINPAVTIAYTAIRHFPLNLAPWYIFAHFIGATLASGLAEIVFSPSNRNIILVAPIGTVLNSVLAETVGGFFLLLVASSVSTDTRAIGQFAGLAVGAIIAIEILVVGPVSGGALNPARAIGPAIVRWNFEHVWIYVVGPIAGGLLGTWVYRLLRPEEVYKFGVHRPIHLGLHSIHQSFRTSHSLLRSRLMYPFFPRH